MTIVQNYFSVTYTQGETFEWKQVLLPTGFSLASLKLILVYFLLGIVEEFAFRWWLKKKMVKKIFCNLCLDFSFLFCHCSRSALELRTQVLGMDTINDLRASCWRISPNIHQIT